MQKYAYLFFQFLYYERMIMKSKKEYGNRAYKYYHVIVKNISESSIKMLASAF